MNARKNVRVDMINSVVELFKTDQSAYPFAPALAEDVAELKQVSNELETSLEKAELSTTDMTTAKQNLKALITTKAKRMMGVGNAYATQKQDKQLNDQLKQFAKQIDKAKDNEFSIFCNNLVKQLRTLNLEDLAKRGVKETDFVDFETQVAQFKGSLPKNQSARNHTSTEKSNSEVLTVKGCSIVNDRIAPTLTHIKDDIPAFFAKFEKASVVRKPATTSSQLKFTFIDDVTGKKIEDVMIQNGELTINAKTTLKQPSNSKKAKDAKNGKGTKTAKRDIIQSDLLEMIKEGYQTQQMPVPKFKRGKITTITVRLTPNV